MSALPDLIGERYKPLRLLGRGGGGAVYEVEHVHTGARLALKVLAGFENASPETVARFRREARLAAAIESEHIVRITDAGTAPELNGTPFLVMELMQGHTLEREAKAPLPPSEVIELLSQVARALERAHAQGIVHRDLKPENLFVTRREDGTPCLKVLDFGIAKRHGEGSTEQGTVLGTPTYMSPEQAQGHGARIDARTDTWALGLVAFRLLFGRPYFEADSTLRLLHRVAFEPMVPPSELGCQAGAAFDAWFMRSCSRDLDERFSSALAQVRELASALSGVREVHIEARPTLELGKRRDAPTTLGEDHPGAGSLTQPASTPRAGHISAARGRVASSVVPLPAAVKRRWFAVGAGISAIMLFAIALWLRTRPMPEAAAPSATPHHAAAPAPAPVALPSEPSEPVLRPPDAPAPALDDAASPDSQPEAMPDRAAGRRSARRAGDAAAAPSSAPSYDPLGDQR